MGLGSKSRQKQTADICKQHPREKHRAQGELVEELFVEIEGASKNCDITRWGQFTDIKISGRRTLGAVTFNPQGGDVGSQGVLRINEKISRWVGSRVSKSFLQNHRKRSWKTW